MVMTAACGGDDSQQGVRVTNNCSLPSGGTYLAHYDETPGNTCGGIPDQTFEGVNLSGQMTDCAGGSGTITDMATDAGGCSIMAMMQGCTIGSVKASIVEDVTWSGGYTAASGMATVNAAGVCSGTYDITVTRQ
jgi:hypothetical protein